MLTIASPNEGDRRGAGALAVGSADRGGAVRDYEPGYGTYGQYDQEGFDFWRTFRTLWRQKWLILAILATGLALTLLLTLRQEPLFKSVATVEIQREQAQIIEGASVEPVTIADAEHIATQISLLRSRMIAERVVEDLNLTTDPLFADQDADRAVQIKQATNRVVEGLSVRPQARSRILEIQYSSPDPRRAAQVANAVVDAFIRSNLERRFNSTRYARTFLTERLAATKEQLEDSERELSRYAEEQGILSLPGDSAGATTTLEASSLVQLNAALNQARDDRIAMEGRFRQAQATGALPAGAGSQNVDQLLALRADLSAQYQRDLAQFKPQFPAMVALANRIATIDDAIRQERQRAQDRLRAEYEAAREREASLAQQVSALRNDVQELRNRSVDYTILQREVDTNRSQYDALLQRLKEVSATEDLVTNQISQVDAAVIPTAAYAPNLPRALLQGGLLSLALGVGLAFAFAYIDNTIKTPEDVRDTLGLAPFGVVPRLDKSEDVTAVLNDPRSPLTEAYNSIRASLGFAIAERPDKGFSLLITGMRPGEGKSTTTTGIAVSFARTGKRVLIIDGDLRKPSFLSGKPTGQGFSRLLVDPGLSLEDHIIGSPRVENLFLLPSGRVPPNPAEILSSARLPSLISEAERMFDVVIVDSSPVLDFADALLLAAACDYTLVTIEAGEIRADAAQRCVTRLQSAATVLLGGILTKFDPQRHGYGYGSSYYAYSYSHYGEDPDASEADSQIASNSARSIRTFLPDDNAGARDA